jgi:hypothetical protein
VPTDLRRFRFWVHDYAPLPAWSAVQVVVVIGIIAGLVAALPFTGVDGWTIGLIVVSIPLIALGVVFLRRARYVAPRRWMLITGGLAGAVVGFGGQLLFAPG